MLRKTGENMKTKIGLLPLYLQLYDDTCTYMRPRIEAFLDEIAAMLNTRGIEVARCAIARKNDEFKASVEMFEHEGVCAIVTLHLAYSPSLECIDALANTKLPIIVLDTTQTYSFGVDTNSDEIMFNHGIHGVQDMCNLLLRRNKPFEIFAGHYEKSNVLNNVAAAARAAAMAANMKTARVGLVGEPFDGMGDFQVPFEDMNAAIGITIVPYEMDMGAKFIAAISQSEIDTEFEDDAAMLSVDPKLSREIYDKTAKIALGIRKWIQEERLSALTINFLSTANSPAGLPAMPFTECSKAMASGIGYAGEGDVLTAALVGAILQIYPDTSFSEMFCPDWQGGSIFLSHMGEINYKACACPPFLTEKDFPFTNADNPTVAFGTLKAGDALFVNIAPTNLGYTLIVAPGKMLDAFDDTPKSIKGWFKPKSPLEDFLVDYSRIGGTHHGAIVYTSDICELKYFASFMGFDFIVI